VEKFTLVKLGNPLKIVSKEHIDDTNHHCITKSFILNIYFSFNHLIFYKQTKILAIALCYTSCIILDLDM